MNDLFEKLSIEANEKSFNYNFDEIYEEQKEALKTLLILLGGVLLIHTIKNEFLSLKSKEKRKIQSEIYKQFDISLENQVDIETKLMSGALTQNTIENYYRKLFVLSLGTNVNIKKLSDSNLKKIINRVVKGETWSDRIWKNKKKLELTLKKDITKFLNGEISVNKIKSAVESRFNTTAYETKRLVETEIARCQSEVNEQFAYNYGFNKQLFMATLDTKTSDICRINDGKVYDIDDPNKPIPPLHPFCRSCLVNIPNEKWRPEKRYDNLDKTEIIWKDYDTWYNENVIIKLPKKLKLDKDSILNESLTFVDEIGLKQFIPANSVIKNVIVMAGAGTSTEFRAAKTYAQYKGGHYTQWRKMGGKITSDKYVFDVHWVEHDIYGKFDAKIKNRSNYNEGVK